MAKRIRIALLLLFFFSATAAAQSVETVIGPPAGSPVLGTQMLFPIYFNNPGNTSVDIDLPATLQCRLSDAKGAMTVTAERVEPDDTDVGQADAEGYVKTLYSLLLPASLAGPVRLTVPALGGASMLFMVKRTAPSFEEKPGVTLAEEEARNKQQLDLSVFMNAYQPYAKNLSFYQPMYFLVGIQPKHSKFQISFKYRFVSPESPLGQKHPWAENIFFGYTQTSFWDLSGASAPFEDTSYKPELFFQTRNIDTGIKLLKGFFIQTGFQHESNGRGGDSSRSTNYIYAEPSFIFLNQKKVTGMRIAPRFWFYVNNDNQTNPELPDYRGYFDLRVTLGKGDGFIYDMHFRWAEEGASLQANLTYPLNRLFHNSFDIYLQAQYTNALAESLLYYTERTDAFRLGLAIVR